MTWLEALARTREPAVLVTVVAARGSTPRDAGCKMVVTAAEQFDTIGGGSLEFTCVTTARAMLSGTAEPVLRDFPLGPALGQCCGGHVTVLFEPMRRDEPHVALFGAGHVGRALATILAMLPMRVTLLDPRPELLLDTPIGVRAMSAADPAGEVASLPHGSFVLVMTHDHQLDFEIVAAALARPDFNGVGLIGSQTKRARFVHRLRRLGLSADCIARLLCPIGIPGVGGKLPAEIAVAVAAQLLTLCRDIPNPHPAAADCHDCARPCLEVPA